MYECVCICVYKYVCMYLCDRLSQHYPLPPPDLNKVPQLTYDITILMHAAMGKDPTSLV